MSFYHNLEEDFHDQTAGQRGFIRHGSSRLRRLRRRTTGGPTPTRHAFGPRDQRHRARPVVARWLRESLRVIGIKLASRAASVGGAVRGLGRKNS